MSKYLNRWVARLLLPFFTLFVVLLPMNNQAYALNLGGAPFGMEAEGLGTAGGILAFPAIQVGAIAFTIGAGIGYIALCPLATIFDPSSTIGQECVTAPSSTAGGSASAAPPPPAPATASTYTTYPYDANGTSYYSYGDACAALKAEVAANLNYGTVTNEVCTDFASNGTVNVGLYNTAANVTFNSSAYGSTTINASQLAAATVCPSGYTLSGSTCNLTNSYAVAANANYNNHNATRSGLTMTLNTGSNGCLTACGDLNAHVITVANSNDSIVVQGLNGDGSGTPLPRVVQVQNLSSGGSTITDQQWSSPSQFTQTQYIVDPSGTVTNVYQTINNGVAPIPSPTSGLAPSNANPANQPASGVYVTNPSLANPTGSVPNAFAASGVDAGKVAADTSQIVSSVNALSGTTENTTDEGYFNHTWEWYMPGHLTYSCSDLYNLGFYGSGSGASSSGPPALHVAGLTFQLPDICSGGYVDDIRMGMDWVMGTYVAYYVFNLIFFKEE